MSSSRRELGLSPSNRKRVFRAQQAVLAYLLDVHPRTPTQRQLEAELEAELEPSEIARASENLRQAGFLERLGETLAPSLAALAFDSRARAPVRW